MDLRNDPIFRDLGTPESIPVRLGKPLVFRASLEIQFEPKVHSDAVLGMIYGKLREEYQDPPQKLPLLDIPAQIREEDPELKFEPCYKLTRQGSFLFVGPRVLAWLVTKYPGWEAFSKIVSDDLEKIFSLDFFEKISKFGLRYVDFLKGNFFSQTKVNFSLNKVDLTDKATTIVTRLEIAGNSCLLRMIKEAMLEDEEGSKCGSIIDIEVGKKISLEPTDSGILESLKKDFSFSHDICKMLFFGLLKPEFLHTLEPEDANDTIKPE